jgi:aminoglycoside phosphotransferase (APT) family kinase protein
MSQPAAAATALARTAELRAALEPMLGPIARLEHRPSAFGTSFAIEEIDVHLEDGTPLPILLKDLSPQALLEGARRVKPAFIHDPLREIEVYRSLLAPHRLGTAHCYGVVTDAAAGRFWLFLERVPGRELYQVGEFSLWKSVTRWLAAFHSRFASDAAGAQAFPLLSYDGDYYRLWLRRAQAFLPAGGPARPGFTRLAGRYGRVVERLLALPVTLLHGEFYASNILVQQTVAGLRVCPVDWEMASIGPGLMDLAALTAGGWTEAQKNELALAYYAQWAAQGAEAPQADAFLNALDHCRLHLAVQWLGWARDWSPPAEHRQDWLGEALRLADKLGL